MVGCQVALSKIRVSVWRLAREAAGCRVVQAALQHASRSDAEVLALELHGHVREGVASPHGNYVLQRLVEAGQLAFPQPD